MSTLSPRNRELLNLIAVGMLTGLGFASVYIARSEVVSPESLTYAAFFLLVYLVAHVVTRLTVPYADPYLLPMAGLLTAIGLIIPRKGLSPFWGRLLDLTESALLLSLVPLCLAVLDVFARARALTS